MKHRLVFKLFSFISTFSILFNSFYAPLYILAQEQQALEPTPTPAESPTTPVPSDNPATPIPTEDPTPALTDAPVTSTPTPTDNLMTPTPTSTFQPTDESTPLVSPSGTVLGEASQITPTPSGNEEIEGEKKLDVFVLENTDANDVEEELLPDFDYTELSSATLTTDKFDYAPTDAVVITGSGFASNTTYELVITSATGNFRFSDNVLSNESGGFIYTYQLDGVYRPEYKVEIFDISGKLITSTFFFDSKAGKIKICHATNSHSKPYIKNKPDIKNDGSLSGGHLNHTGPLWYLGITEKWGDIIPPYQSGNFSYPGMNWNAQGQAIWNNDCKIPTPSPTPTPCVEGQTWASGVFDFEQGTKKNGDPVEDDRSDPDNALGVPDSPQPTIKFFSLGKDGWIILTFAGWILDVNGSDLSFHEVTWGRDSYPVEKAKVEVSQNGTDWFGSWEVTNKDGGNGVGYVDFSATGLPWIKYVRITDITDYSLHGNDADGYDLDAVDGVSQVCQQPQPSVTPTPTPTLTPTPTPQPYCGDGKINQNSEQCDGTDGVTQGRNFCTSTCKLIPIYTGGRTCSNGKVPVLRSELSRTISSTSTSPVTVNLPNVNEYLFEVIGDYGYGGVPTNNQVHRADAGYATAEDAGSAWAALRHDIGIEPGAIYRGVTSLLSDFGTGNMGVVDWGAYSPTHIYTVVNTPASISDTTFRFVISDWYSDWYNGGGNNNQGGMWDNEGSLTLNVYECLSSTNVSGQKYNDHNYNGQKDNSEPGLEDWTIYLAKKVDEVNVPALNMPTIPSNITLASGTKYLLRVSGTFGAGDNITGDAKYSVRSPNTYWTDSVQNYESYGPTLLDLQINNSSVNWGTYNPSHIYWLTYTGTGSPINFRIYDIYPPNNSGQLNVKIYQVIDETQTDSSGNYQFNYNGELTGEVIVAEETQSGWIQTAPGEGYCPISSYQQNTCDFGNAAGKGWIIVEKQTIPDGSDQSFEFSGAVSGSLIDNQRLVSQELPAGGYSVGEGTVEGWDLSDITCDDPTQNSYSNLPSAPTATINLAAGETVTCTFTNTKRGSISGYKWEDLDGNGVWDNDEPGISEWIIFIDEDSDGVLGDEETSLITDDNGYYEFENLASGTYSVCETLKDGWERTYPSNSDCHTVTVVAGQETGNVNFGNFKLGVIQGRKYDDLNGDGTRDSGEPYLDGWTIRLYRGEDEGWSLVDTKSTGHTGVLGQYKFINLEPGRYKVCEVMQNGWVQTSPSGPTNRVASDEAPRCRVVNINLSGEVASGRNFGNFKLGKIYGYKYDEDGKTGLNGWSIFIDGDKDGKLDEGETVVQTGSSEWQDGYFEFTGLTAGKYSICEEEQQGWQRMYPLGTNCQSVSISSGSETKIDFQNRKVVLGLTLTKSNNAPTTSSAGSQVAYTLVIKNTGNQDLTGVIVKDAPAGGFTYVAGSGKLGTDPITPTISGGYLEWYIGVLGAGEEKTLTYKMQSDPTLVAGIYPNVAIATGIYIPSEYVPPESSEAAIFKPLVVEALAVTEEAETPSEGERVESNAGVPVNSEVRIASSLSYSTGVGSTGEVLGASTEAVEGAVLPAAGSSTWNLAVALLSLLFGFGLKALSVAVEKNRINTKRIRKGLKKAGVFLASLVLFLVLSTPLKAFSDYVYITKLDSYLNKENFYLSYSALSENPISAQFYVRKDGDATWRTLGSALTGASGQVEVKPADIYGGDAKYFFKVVINGGTASDETSTIIDRNAPDPVRDYRKEKLGDGHYKLYWRNPDNADYDRVKIYRSENKNFTADSSTEVATLWGTAGSEMTSESAAAPGKEYYFAIRAIDKAGNASSVVADPETQVTVVSSTVLGKTTEVSGTEEVKILPKEEKKGEVLGEEKAEGEEKAGETAPVESPKPQTAGVLGQAVQFAKDRTKLTLFIAFVLGLMSTLAFRALRKRKG